MEPVFLHLFHIDKYSIIRWQSVTPNIGVKSYFTLVDNVKDLAHWLSNIGNNLSVTVSCNELLANVTQNSENSKLSKKCDRK